MSLHIFPFAKNQTSLQDCEIKKPPNIINANLSGLKDISLELPFSLLPQGIFIFPIPPSVSFGTREEAKGGRGGESTNFRVEADVRTGCCCPDGKKGRVVGCESPYAKEGSPFPLSPFPFLSVKSESLGVRSRRGGGKRDYPEITISFLLPLA